MSSFKQQLVDLNACAEAIAWVGDRDEAAAWRECERGDWLLWWLRASKAEVTDRQYRHIACDIAQDAVDQHWRGGPEPQAAIDAARAYADDPTLENLEAMRVARSAAWAAAWASVAEVWAALLAAAWAAAWAAWAAVEASAWAWMAVRHADVVRKWVVR